MYHIPKDLDLSAAVGQCITQFCVGAWDLQFDLGDVHFAVQSEIAVSKKGDLIGRWQPKSWPSVEFIELFNIEVTEVTVPNEYEIVIAFANDMSMHIYDNSEQYESMQIQIRGTEHLWVRQPPARQHHTRPGVAPS